MANPSLLLIGACAPQRPERGNVTLNRLYFVGYVTVKQHPLAGGPGPIGAVLNFTITEFSEVGIASVRYRKGSVG